jgi:DNA-binding CsgD family transcriptional regulator
VDAVHAEVVRAGLAVEDRDRVLRALADALDRCGAAGRHHLDVAGWRLQVGGWSPEHLGDAAVLARCAGETGLAVALADAALRDGAGSAAARVRSLAGVELRAGQATGPGPAPQVGVPDDASSVTDPLLAAQALAIGAGRWQEAVDGLLAPSASTDTRAEVGVEVARGYAAVLAALGGRGHVAAALLEGDDPGPLAEVAGTLVAAAAGDVDQARQHAERIAVCTDGQDLVPLASELARGHLLLVDTDEPLEDRIEDAAAEVDKALARLSAGTAWWSAVEGWLRWEAGQLGLARDRLTSALLACADADPTRLHPLLLADLAVLAASTGAAIEARWRLSQLGEDRTSNPAVAHRCAVAEALIGTHPSSGPLDHDTATTLLRLAAEAAQEGRGRDAAGTCHLVVRRAVPASLEVPAVTLAGADALVVAHVTAWTSGDAGALDAVARRFAAAGRRLVAAEAAQQAAAAGGGERSGSLAAALAAGLTGPLPAALTELAPVRISPRRRDAAVLAMQGCDDRRIATELGLSVRTVENHLAKVYRQVGVAGRGELAELFDPAWPPFDRAVVGDR